LEVLLMYINLDVVSMYCYDLLSFRYRALCNIINNDTNVYYATTYIASRSNFFPLSNELISNLLVTEKSCFQNDPLLLP
jgi:hypothetical protein